MGVNGMVASAHPLATLAGLEVLRDGGNAFDAVVATASTLNVVEPYMSGMGGIGVALAHVAAEGRVRALDFAGKMPGAAEPELFNDEKMENGILAALVPGNLAGWLTLHETYGSMDRKRVFSRAIAYAEDGFPITHINSTIIGQTAHLLEPFPSSVSIILESGKAPRPGKRLRMPQLAESFRRVAAGGLDTFYRGELAGRIVAGNNEHGGIFSDDDLGSYEAEWREPISATYRGFEVFTTPPACSSFQVLQTLKLMETFDDADLGFQRPETLHSFIEAVKLSAADRIRYAGEPSRITAPLAGLLSADYARRQRDRIGPAAAIGPPSGEHYARERITGALKPGTPEAFDGGMTTHFAVADRDGNVVTVTQTLGGGFGSGAVVGDTGIFLNNMASYFDLDEGSPNQIGPGRRVDFVVAPTQTFKSGQFHLSLGTPGSYGILQTTPQMLMNVLDHGMTPQQAIDAPRLKCTVGKGVQMEERFPGHVRQRLGERGHKVSVLEAWSRGVGGAQAIQADQAEGTFQGGADPRRDGYALGW